MITVQKIFIFSNSIGTYTFLYTIEWLCGTDIDTIITTDEIVFRNLINSFKYKINYYDSIEACISNCDVVLVCNDKNLPGHVINEIKSISIIQNKKYIEIDSCKNIDTKEEYNFINGINPNTPVVVIFSMGLATISTKVEFDVNRIFSDEGVPINHFLSPESKHTVCQFRDAGIGVDRVVKKLNGLQHANVFVYYLDLDNNIHNIYKHYNFLTTIKPDYIIVLTDYDLSDYDELRMYMKCFCARYPDVIVKSRWFSIGNNMLCHSDNFDDLQQGNNQYVLDFEDKDFYKKLQFDMFSKITLAEGIKRIH